VPVLRHGDITLFESSAIARYLDDIGGGTSLVPAAAVARAEMEQWISAINCYVYDSLIKSYALKYIFAKLAGREPDHDQIRAGVPNLERDVAKLDAAYAGRDHLAGGALSLADLFVAPIVQTISMFPEGQRALSGATHLARAYDKLRARDSFAKVHAQLG
jgi:glutathione S-transferase